MKYVLAGAICLLPCFAQAFPCQFTTECYEAEACSATAFNIEVDIDAKVISTDFGDLTIVAIKEARNLTTGFATGAGAEYMISLTPTGARITTHNNSGPEAITYLGTCEGAF